MKRTKEGESIVSTNNGMEELLNYNELMLRFFKYEFWGFPGGLYHRSVFDHLVFPKATLSEDYYIKAQMFYHEQQMSITSAPLYFYEYHPTSLSHTQLSERAFEEFENVKAVYDYSVKNCPDFSANALSNVVETSVKLFNMGAKSDHRRYSDKFTIIFAFLKKNKKQIWSLEVLNKHVRFMALGIIICPSLIRIVCRWL